MSEISTVVETGETSVDPPIGGKHVAVDFSGKEKVMAAICKCMLAIGKIGKEGRNAHANYSFASIDDFLAITSQACGSNGVVVLQQEVSCSTVSVNNRAWVMMEFEFIVCHASGQSLPPVRRSVGVMWSGSQSYGSAQSYALKQFLRSLFQIACGDNDDPDYQEQVSANRPSDTPIAAKKPAKKTPAKKAPAKKAPAKKPKIEKETIDRVESMISELEWFFFNKQSFWKWLGNYTKKDVKVITDDQLIAVCNCLADFKPANKWHSKWKDVHLAMIDVERPGQATADLAISGTFGADYRKVSEADVSMINGLIEIQDTAIEDLLKIIKTRYGRLLEDLSFDQGCELIKAGWA